MPTSQELQARSLFVESITDLIRHYVGVTPHAALVPEPPPAEWLAIELGFGGFFLSGSSTLSATAATAQRLTDNDGSIADPEDWLAELNNQVLGRLKNKLVRLGVPITVSTPMNACGGLMALGAARPDPVTWRVKWSGGELYATLSLAVASHVAFTPGAEQAVREEGSLSLF